MKKKNRRGIIFIIVFILIVGSIYLFDYMRKKNNSNPDQGDNTVQVEPTDPTKIVEPQEPKTYLNKITYTKKIDKEIEKVLIDYFDIYFSSLKNLKEQDMTNLFSNEEQAKINQTAVSLLINIRKMQKNDLKLSNVKYDLNIKEVQTNGNKIKITVLEDSTFNFNFMSEIESKVYNVKNEFTLIKQNDTYKIEEFSKIQDFFVMITSKYTVGNGIEKLTTIKNDFIKKIEIKLENEKTLYDNYTQGIDAPVKQCDNNYDRIKALSYAKKWVNSRNDSWVVFDSNCQNFASQVVNSGGVPMDHYGTESKQWKAYGYATNASETASGLVESWTYVPSFMTYAKNNTGYGLCALTNVNIYYAEAGDVIHVGINSSTRHALVSIGTYKKNGKLLDILVNSNTVDLENYPLSAYVYPYINLIKIMGWNN